MSQTTDGGRTEAYEANRRYAMLRLGLGCNASCLFCNVPAESYNYPRQLSWGPAQRALARIVASGGDRLEISGGEPTLRPDLEEIIRCARSSGIRLVELQTNGILLRSRERAAALRGAGLTAAFVGLHSHWPKAHDFLLGVPGAFAACVAGIRNLVQEGVEVVLNPVLTKANYRHLVGYLGFVRARLEGVRSICLSVVQPHGRAWAHRSLVPRYGDVSPVVERALAAAEGLGLRLTNPYCGLPLCIGGWHEHLSRCVEYCEAELGRRPGDGMKTHPEECSGCGLRSHCGGVWKEYPLLHPVSDLRPLRV